jgi:hypothetical protein
MPFYKDYWLYNREHATRERIVRRYSEHNPLGLLYALLDTGTYSSELDAHLWDRPARHIYSYTNHPTLIVEVAATYDQ